MTFPIAIHKAVVFAVLAILFVPHALAVGKVRSYAFKGKPDGQRPSSGLVEDSAGNFFGITYLGGANDSGAAFQLSPPSGGRPWSVTIIYSFSNNPGVGYLPTGNLALDGAGNLYGTTTDGGSQTCNCGGVFELVRGQNTWTEKTLYTFQGGLDGNQPRQGVVFDSFGNLYGTTSFGGSLSCSGYDYGCGMVFKLTPNQDGSWAESTVYDFQGNDDGSFPNGVVVDGAGNLYGTTNAGGGTLSCAPVGCGTAFEIVPNVNGSWTENVLYRFTDGLDGGYPAGNLVFDEEGNLYGAAGSGGSLACPRSGCGVIFELAPGTGGTWTETTVHTFNGLNGSKGWGPDGGLSFDNAGNIYGATGSGGNSECEGYGCGVIFKLVPKVGGGFTFSIVAVLDDIHGANPGYGVIVDAHGHLYGTANNGGDFKCNEGPGCGTVFEFTP